MAEPAVDTWPRPAARILVADDNALSAELMQDQLESHGYVVDYAADGARALTMAASGAYQVLLLDVNMPVYDGVEVVRRLHEQSPATPVKVIVVTADRFATRHAELSRRGIDGYMTKPVDFDRLNNEISRLLALDHA